MPNLEIDRDVVEVVHMLITDAVTGRVRDALYLPADTTVIPAVTVEVGELEWKWTASAYGYVLEIHIPLWLEAYRLDRETWGRRTMRAIDEFADLFADGARQHPGSHLRPAVQP